MVPASWQGNTPMSKLSDTQSIILSAAAQRADGNVLPLPGSLRGGAAVKVVAALLARGLIREHIVDSPRKADTAMNTVWRNLDEPDGRGVLLYITAAGAEAIGVEPAAADEPEPAATEPVEPEGAPQAVNDGANSADEPAAGAPTRANVRRVSTAPRVAHQRRDSSGASSANATSSASAPPRSHVPQVIGRPPGPAREHRPG